MATNFTKMNSQGNDFIVIDIAQEQFLENQDNIKKFNDNVIWPNKVRINIQYIETYSFYKDLYYIWKTIIQ